MTVPEFEKLMKEFPTKDNGGLKRVEIPPEVFKALAADLFDPLVPVEFIYNGVTVAPGAPGMISKIADGLVFSWSLGKAIPPPFCDCGAVKTNQPGHSTWCTAVRA